MSNVTDFGLTTLRYLPPFKSVLILHNDQFVFAFHQIRIRDHRDRIHGLRKPLLDWIFSPGEDVVFENIGHFVLLVHLLDLHIVIFMLIIYALKESIPIEIIRNSSFF